MKIFLSGGQKNLDKEDRTSWRKWIKRDLSLDTTVKCEVFDPTEYFDYDLPYNSERQVMNYDLWNLRNSDIVVVNFNDPKSIGTATEIATAYELRKPIIGLHEDKTKPVYPWHKEMVDYMADDLEDLVWYLKLKYLSK